MNVEKDKKLHKLAYWRKKIGLKQEDVALLLGCKPANYCAKETGRVSITCDEMLKIRTAFNKILEKRKENLLQLDDIFLP